MAQASSTQGATSLATAPLDGPHLGQCRVGCRAPLRQMLGAPHAQHRCPAVPWRALFGEAEGGCDGSQDRGIWRGGPLATRGLLSLWRFRRGFAPRAWRGVPRGVHGACEEAVGKVGFGRLAPEARPRGADRAPPARPPLPQGGPRRCDPRYAGGSGLCRADSTMSVCADQKTAANRQAIGGIMCSPLSAGSISSCPCRAEGPMGSPVI